jgi:hypothetical protein
MAGLWSGRLMSHDACASLRGMVRCIALVLALLTMPGCSELAQPSEAVPPGPEPAYVPPVAKYLRTVLVDRSFLDGFEISGVRWVHSIRGWNWLACVHFQDHGHRRIYALFVQRDTVVDARYAVETDACESQTYTQFDVMSGVIGRPTAPVQAPIY